MEGHKWQLPPAFADTFGWRSATPIPSGSGAISEIKTVRRIQCSLPRAVILLRKLSPALEQVDNSSSAIRRRRQSRRRCAGTRSSRRPMWNRPTRQQGTAGAPVASRRVDNSVHQCLADDWGNYCATPETGDFLGRSVSTQRRASPGDRRTRIWIFQGDSCVPFCAVRGGSPRSTAGAAGAGTVQVVARSALGREGTGGHGKKGGGSPLRQERSRAA